MSDETVILAARVQTLQNEEEVTRIARVVRSENRGPIHAARTVTDDVTAAVAIARSGQENPFICIACLSGLDLVTYDSIDCSPGPIAVFRKFFQLFRCRHTPIAAEYDVSHVIFRIEDGLVVGAT